jgi:DNA polymerase-1
MRHHRYSVGANSTYPLVILVPEIQPAAIRDAYLDPFGIDPEEVMVLSLHHSREKKKTPITEIREFITEELIPAVEAAGAQYLVVTDSEYFKALTTVPKVDANLGYVLNTPYGPYKVVYVPSFKTIFYDPDKVRAKISQGMTALVDHASGAYQAPGHEIIKFEEYPHTSEQIEEWLCKLLDMNCPLTIDIEGFDLKHHKAGIGSIAFAWSKHEGIAFAVDYVSEEWTDDAGGIHYGRQIRNTHLRAMLVAFFEQLLQKAIYHNISFDVYVLIYQLFMKDILDTEGLLRGMEIMLRNWDCTKLISFLATNTCAGNELGLKAQAQEFAGNYSMGEDIKDITLIPMDKLLRYNLIDCMSTWHVHEKHYRTMVADQQLEFYENIFKPAVKDVVQMQLTGLPVNMRKVKIVKYLLERDEREALAKLRASPIAQQYTMILRQAWIDKMNQEWKKKRGTLDDVPAKIVFNPRSGPQLQELLFDMLALPVLDFTPTKEPATGGKTLEKLVHHAKCDLVRDFITALIEYSKVVKILGDFIPSFLGAAKGPDGWHYLFGYFNLGGTISGRLSSSNPNLQNLPASSKYAKWIKWCVEAIAGWIFCGLDFASLEDKISALTSKDPNKIAVYTGHIVYKLSINGIDHHVRDDTTIIYDGKEMRADAYFVTHCQV